MLALPVVTRLALGLAGYASYFQADPRILEFTNCLPTPHPGSTYSGCCRTEHGLRCLAQTHLEVGIHCKRRLADSKVDQVVRFCGDNLLSRPLDVPSLAFSHFFTSLYPDTLC